MSRARTPPLRPAGNASVPRNRRVGAGVGGAIAVGAALGIGTFVNGVLGSGSLKDPFGGSSSYFPEDLTEMDHWIEFTAKETEGRATAALEKFFDQKLVGSTILGGTIRLPMPSNLSTDYNPNYSEESLGPGLGMALKPIERSMYGMGSMGNDAAAGTALSGLVKAIGGVGAGALTQGTATAVDKLAGGAATGAGLKIGAGVAINQHKIVLFTGVNFREHQFSWKLSPKNREESNAIKKIIDMFAYYSHPEFVAGGLFFKYPEFFQIKFRYPEYLFELQPSVCTDIRVNYHGQGYAGYIRDADGFGVPAPVEVELALTFKEVEIITKKELNPNVAGGTTYRANPTRRPDVTQQPRAETMSTMDGFLPPLPVGPTRTQGDR
jgi:hypothetical protein